MSQNSPYPPHHSGYIGRSLVFIVMVMTEVVIGLRPANFIHITMVDYTFPTQGFLKKLFQEVWKDKIHIKIILIILIQSSSQTLVQACHNIHITT